MSTLLRRAIQQVKSILDVAEVFATTLYTGTGVAHDVVSGLDSVANDGLLWIKSRSNASSNQLFDTLRGLPSYLASDNGLAENTAPDVLEAFNVDGFEVGTLNGTNGSARTYVAWQFLKAAKFFDVVEYTGDGLVGKTVAHQLGIAPGLVIVKGVTNADFWYLQHISLGGGEYIRLNSANASVVSSAIWNGVNATADTITLGSNAGVNGSSIEYVAYVFAHDPSPEGIIQCGSYTGNGSATGPVVDLGWTESIQYIMVKKATGAANDWLMFDTARGLTGSGDEVLFANTATAGSVQDRVEPTATGFKIINGGNNINTSGETYIYMAIRAEA